MSAVANGGRNMDILQSRHDDEKWMAEHTHVVAADLRLKHVQNEGVSFCLPPRNLLPMGATLERALSQVEP